MIQTHGTSGNYAKPPSPAASSTVCADRKRVSLVAYQSARTLNHIKVVITNLHDSPSSDDY